MNEERFLDLAARRLLEGLPPEELAELEAELGRRGADGRRAVERIRATLGDLALAAEPVAPPPGLRARVLAAAGETSRAAVPLRRPRRGLAWTAAIAAGVALLLGGWSLRLRSELGRAAEELAAARLRLEAADSLAALVTALRADLMTLAAPEGRALALSGTGAQPGARARVFVDPSTGRAILFAYELPILGPDLVYQLWAIRDGSPASAGVFAVGADRRGRLEVDPETIEGAEVLAVTVEPSPGRPAPSGEVVLAGSI